jgi:fatty acid desaturase
LLVYASGITIILAIIAATIFTPYMVYIFIKEKKIAWIISFLVVVIIPFIICIILGIKTGYVTVFILIPLGIFYFYCFVLKLTVNEQLKEVIAEENLQIKRDLSEKRLHI